MKRLAVPLIVVLGLVACGAEDDAGSGRPAPTTVVASGASDAADRLATAELRNAFAAEKVFYVDNLKYTESLDEIRAIEPALTYAVGLQPGQVRTIHVKVEGEVLYLSARSRSGRCFYVRDQGTTDAGFAIDTACGSATNQDYAASW